MTVKESRTDDGFNSQNQAASHGKEKSDPKQASLRDPYKSLDKTSPFLAGLIRDHDAGKGAIGQADRSVRLPVGHRDLDYYNGGLMVTPDGKNGSKLRLYIRGDRKNSEIATTKRMDLVKDKWKNRSKFGKVDMLEDPKPAGILRDKTEVVTGTFTNEGKKPGLVGDYGNAVVLFPPRKAPEVIPITATGRQKDLVLSIKPAEDEKGKPDGYDVTWISRLLKQADPVGDKSKSKEPPDMICDQYIGSGRIRDFHELNDKIAQTHGNKDALLQVGDPAEKKYWSGFNQLKALQNGNLGAVLHFGVPLEGQKYRGYFPALGELTKADGQWKFLGKPQIPVLPDEISAKKPKKPDLQYADFPGTLIDESDPVTKKIVGSGLFVAVEDTEPHYIPLSKYPFSSPPDPKINRHSIADTHTLKKHGLPAAV